ncbi:MAG: (d)CMP kinase [Tenericutes bacterium]|nr:MAG: (d)CMP kinase [Mycoplasmatota bacterium]
MIDNKIKIAIDGGAGTGKTSVANLLSDRTNLEYINTGEMYRLFTLISFQNNLLNESQKLVDLLKENTFNYLGGKIISSYDFNNDDLHTSLDVINNVSKVAADEIVRTYAMELQKQIARDNEGIILEGRDIGSEIMPNADFKFFLTVSPEVAATRRHEQMIAKGKESNYDDVLSNIIERNKIDSTRTLSPLVKAEDAVEIKTDNHTVSEIVDTIIKRIKNEE